MARLPSLSSLGLVAASVALVVVASPVLAQLAPPAAPTKALTKAQARAAAAARTVPASAPGVAAVPALDGSGMSAEDRLEAIRASLVQTALQGATRVESLAWIDAQGALREGSSFRSGMQVRGVQVMGYQRDSAGQPQAQLQVATRLDTVRAGPTGDSKVDSKTDSRADTRADTRSHSRAEPGAPGCDVPGSLRHQIGLNVVVDGGWSVDEAPLAQALAQLSSAWWFQAGSNSAVWRMVPQEAPQSSVYAQALLGTSVDQLPWRAVLSVRPARTLAPTSVAAPAGRAWGLPLPWAESPPVLARLQLSVLARGQSQPAFEASGDVALPHATLDWQAPQLSPAARAQSAALAQQWAQRLTQQLLCEAVRPEVVQTRGRELRINAGVLAGVRAGDEWLLADPRRFPHQVLEPGVAAQAVLARVQHVHADHAQLQVLAGQGEQVRAGWRAWSAEALPTLR